MNIFSKINKIKKEFEQKKRTKTAERLKQTKAELKLIKAKNQIYIEDAKTRKELIKSKKDLFEAKHPIISAGLKKAGDNIKKNRKKAKVKFNQGKTNNPWNYQPKNPWQ